MFYGPQGHYIGFWSGLALEQSLRSLGDYIDVRQCKSAGYFAEEGGFLVIRFDHGEMDLWGPQL
jgi:hypothetical protein